MKDAQNGGVLVDRITDKFDPDQNKKENPTKYEFTIPYKNSYEMSVDNVSTSSFTSGLRGICRYRYKNAINDPSAGMIECYNLDNYDSLIVSLSCTKNLIKE